jgi:hypothetical protein
LDWRAAFDHLCKGDKSWHSLLAVPGSFLGPMDDTDTSDGILLFFRWLLLQHLRPVMHQYTTIIVTRSDYLYLCRHPPLRSLDMSFLWTTDGVANGGVSDRHQVFSVAMAEQVLGVTDRICRNSVQLANELISKHVPINIEKYLQYIYSSHHIGVRSFSRTMFAVENTKIKKMRFFFNQTKGKRCRY